MTERLIIRINGEDAEWLLLSGNTALAAHPRASLGEALRAIPAASRERRVVLLAPGDAVLLTSAEIPAQQSRYLDQVLAYAVEEQLAEDVAGLHLVGARGAGGRVGVAAVRRDLLKEWLETLASYGIAPGVAVAETLCLPVESGQWAALMDDGRLVVRSGASAGFSITEEEWPSLAALAAGDASLRTLMLLHGPEHQPQGLADALNSASEGKLAISLRPVPMSALEVLARGYLVQEEALAPLNLLQGEFAARSAVSSGDGWRKLALIASVWFGLTVLINGGKWLYLEYKTSQIESQQTELYRRLFPQEKRIVNAYAQMKNKLNAGGSFGDGFARQIQDVASAWQSVGGAKAVQFEQMRYDAQKNELVATLLSADVGTLENFRRALEQAGWLVELSSATRQQDKMQGVIRISGNESKG